MNAWVDGAVAALLVAGAWFTLVGSFGLVRFVNFFARLHGPTKATTLGVGCVLAASSLFFTAASGAVSVHELLVVAFLFLTAPVSAHLLVKAALRRKRARTARVN